VKESCKIKGDSEITGDAKKETNKYNMSGVSADFLDCLKNILPCR
jgi:hypothetical protein